MIQGPLGQAHREMAERPRHVRSTGSFGSSCDVRSSVCSRATSCHSYQTRKSAKTGRWCR